MPNVRHDSNLLITVLFFFIWMLKTSGDLFARASRTLHLQVDGGSENANRFGLRSSGRLNPSCLLGGCWPSRLGWYTKAGTMRSWCTDSSWVTPTTLLVSFPNLVS